MERSYFDRPLLESATVDTATASGDTLLGMAAMGKTAAALALVIAIILLCSYLLRRLGPNRHFQNQRLKVVGSTAVGSRERVVIVEVEDTWLVLGVGGGQVNKLHELSAPIEPARSVTPPDPEKTGAEATSFAGRFAYALKHNATQTLGRARHRSRGES
ncbi:flagellar biosynthetic protein FliO [Halomonas sp. PA5]|nr:flagellar biosynthetic protein FliO [Halomonas sp. PA5]